MSGLAGILDSLTSGILMLFVASTIGILIFSTLVSLFLKSFRSKVTFGLVLIALEIIVSIWAGWPMLCVYLPLATIAGFVVAYICVTLLKSIRKVFLSTGKDLPANK